MYYINRLNGFQDSEGEAFKKLGVTLSALFRMLRTTQWLPILNWNHYGSVTNFCGVASPRKFLNKHNLRSLRKCLGPLSLSAA